MSLLKCEAANVSGELHRLGSVLRKKVTSVGERRITKGVIPNPPPVFGCVQRLGLVHVIRDDPNLIHKWGRIGQPAGEPITARRMISPTNVIKPDWMAELISSAYIFNDNGRNQNFAHR